MTTATTTTTITTAISATIYSHLINNFLLSSQAETVPWENLHIFPSDNVTHRSDATSDAQPKMKRSTHITDWLVNKLFIC